MNVISRLHPERNLIESLESARSRMSQGYRPVLTHWKGWSAVPQEYLGVPDEALRAKLLGYWMTKEVASHRYQEYPVGVNSWEDGVTHAGASHGRSLLSHSSLKHLSKNSRY
jgi:hypothetical protein